MWVKAISSGEQVVRKGPGKQNEFNKSGLRWGYIIRLWHKKECSGWMIICMCVLLYHEINMFSDHGILRETGNSNNGFNCHVN